MLSGPETSLYAAGFGEAPLNGWVHKPIVNVHGDMDAMQTFVPLFEIRAPARPHSSRNTLV